MSNDLIRRFYVMNILTSNSVLTAQNKSGHIIIIYEPNAIASFGLRQVLTSYGIDDSCQFYIHDLSSIMYASCYLLADVILISTGVCNREAMSILQFLSNKANSENTIPVIVRMENYNPTIERLFLAFGANDVLPFGASIHALSGSLSEALDRKRQRTTLKRLTRREREVVCYLLTGKKLTQIASLIGRDIRTASAHKQKAITKLGMNSVNELQILAGQLHQIQE